MLKSSASLAISTSILKALPGKLDIKRHKPSILHILTPSKGDNQYLPVIVLQPDIIIVLMVCNLLLVPKSPSFTLPLLSRNILAPEKKKQQNLVYMIGLEKCLYDQ